MKKALQLIALAIVFFSCQNKEEGFVIKGEIQGIKDSSLIRLYHIDLQTNIDSTFTKDGKFTLKGIVDEPTTCWLMNGQEYAIVQVENVNMTFESPEKNMFLNSSITGGREQTLQNELKALQMPYDEIYMAAYDSIVNRKYEEGEESALFERYSGAQTKSHEVYIDFGRENPDSYLGLDILYRNRKAIPKDSLRLIYEGLSDAYKNTSLAKSINIFLTERTVEVGESYIDFEAKDLKGQPFKLSSIEGKNIYLTFWSVGCGPCRMENRFLSKRAQEVPEDLEIVSFSIDKDAAIWKSASEKDEIWWHNVSDLAGGEGRVKTLYNVQAIPASFLIDKKGSVIKRFRGFNTEGNLLEELKTEIAKHNHID
ncbi:MAG: TlpA disulfide reductase family protein [Bacteroidota bacterium]